MFVTSQNKRCSQVDRNDTVCFVLFCFVTSQSTTNVMSRWAFNLWAGLDLSGQPVLSAHLFTSSWQLPYLNQRNGEWFHDQSLRKNIAGPEDRTCDLLNTSRMRIRPSFNARQNDTGEWLTVLNLNHVSRKPLFGELRSGKTQIGLLGYRLARILE